MKLQSDSRRIRIKAFISNSDKSKFQFERYKFDETHVDIQNWRGRFINNHLEDDSEKYGGQCVSGPGDNFPVRHT